MATARSVMWERWGSHRKNKLESPVPISAQAKRSTASGRVQPRCATMLMTTVSSANRTTITPGDGDLAFVRGTPFSLRDEEEGHGAEPDEKSDAQNKREPRGIRAPRAVAGNESPRAWRKKHVQKSASPHATETMVSILPL